MPESTRKSKVIATFKAFADHHGSGKSTGFSSNPYRSEELTDVDALGTFGLGGIYYVKLDDLPGRDAAWGVEVMYHAPGTGGALGAFVCFEDKASRDKFVSELDAAITAWRAKYSEVAEVPYLGIK